MSDGYIVIKEEIEKAEKVIKRSNIMFWANAVIGGTLVLYKSWIGIVCIIMAGSLLIMINSVDKLLTELRTKEKRGLKVVRRIVE